LDGDVWKKFIFDANVDSSSFGLTGDRFSVLSGEGFSNRNSGENPDLSGEFSLLASQSGSNGMKFS
jgi:hypothetical protein